MKILAKILCKMGYHDWRVYGYVKNILGDELKIQLKCAREGCKAEKTI